MLRFFFYLSFFLFSVISIQAQDILSLKSGFSHLRQEGFGLHLSYSHQVQEKLFISSTFGILFFNDRRPSHLYWAIPESTDDVLDNAQTFSFGLKYFIGNENFNPYLSVFWGLIRRSGEEYITYPDNKHISAIFNGHKTDISSFMGFEFGTLLKIATDLNLDFSVNSGYGRMGELISFSGGVAYNF